MRVSCINVGSEMPHLAHLLISSAITVLVCVGLYSNAMKDASMATMPMFYYGADIVGLDENYDPLCKLFVIGCGSVLKQNL